MPEKRAREWVWTYHCAENWSPDARGALGLEWEAFCTYLCYQPELAPTTGAKHLQGYVCLTTPRTLRGIKQVLFPSPLFTGIHLEIARGSKAECRAYSSKDETRAPDAGFGFIELGRYEDVPDQRGQGARNDIHAATELIRAGGTLQTVAQEHGEAYVKFHRGFLAFQSAIHSGPRVRDAGGVFQPPRVFWFYGSTGTGKTLAVFEASGAEEVYSKPGGNDWWDGYCGQPVVLLDDYRGNWFPFANLLRLLDRYPLQVPFKGGYVPFNSPTIYITCPVRPEVLYSSMETRTEGSIAQLLRRITEVRLFGDEPPPPGPMVDDFNPH